MVMFVIFCVQSYFIKRERVSAKMRLSSSQQTFGRGMTTLHNKVSSTSRTGVCLPAFGGLMIINAVCLLFCFLFFLNQLKCFSVTLDSRHKTGCRVVILKKKKKIIHYHQKWPQLGRFHSQECTNFYRVGLSALCFFLFVVVVVVFFYSDSQCWFKTSKSVHKKQGRKCIFHSGVLLGLSGIIGRPQAKAWREMFQHFQKRFNICWVGFFYFFLLLLFQ